MALPQTIAIGRLAARTGLSVSAIRYYEAEGLVSPERNAAGQRRFLRADIRRLSFVKIAQQFGLSIARIRQELQVLPNGRAPNKADWAKISRRLRASLDARIDILTRLRDNLDGCIGCGCLSLETCALYNPADQAAKLGAGPHYLTGERPSKQQE